jgi:hypothetical protein
MNPNQVLVHDSLSHNEVAFSHSTRRYSQLLFTILVIEVASLNISDLSLANAHDSQDLLLWFYNCINEIERFTHFLKTTTYLALCCKLPSTP